MEYYSAQTLGPKVPFNIKLFPCLEFHVANVQLNTVVDNIVTSDLEETTENLSKVTNSGFQTLEPALKNDFDFIENAEKANPQGGGYRPAYIIEIINLIDIELIKNFQMVFVQKAM